MGYLKVIHGLSMDHLTNHLRVTSASKNKKKKSITSIVKLNFVA
ncbi:11861_t:CDS:1, partial [Dentiscutata heterogama]